MKLSVLLVGFAATTVVLWLFVFLADVQARPTPVHAPIAAASVPFTKHLPMGAAAARSLDAG